VGKGVSALWEAADKQLPPDRPFRHFSPPKLGVPTDDLGSKAESARIAFEELICCLARAAFNLDAPAGRLAVENAAKAIALKL